jgi:hypothetical protein
VLLGLARGAQVLGVRIDAVGAAVDLGGAQLDQVAQARLEADVGGIEGVHRA